MHDPKTLYNPGASKRIKATMIVTSRRMSLIA
jgi:hypothetical protein